MKMEAYLQPQLQQKLKLAPQIIQSIEILQLPLLALVERVQMELEENPVLEELTLTEKPSEEERKATEEEGLTDILPEEWQVTSSFRSKAARQEDSDLKQQALENTACKPISLHEYLLGQLSLMELPKGLLEVCELVVSHVDDRGYLTTSNLEEIISGAERSVSLNEAQQALLVVQSLEPPGIGARNLQECLLLQLDQRSEGYNLLKELITHHLKDIEAKRYHDMARDLGTDVQSIKKAVNCVRTLNPYPGSLFVTEPLAYVVPDVRVEYVDGQYEIILNENSALPRIAVNPLYKEFIHQTGTDTQTRHFLQKKLESARWLIEAIEQRKATLFKIAVKLVEHQGDFLEQGISGLKPLRMQEIADQLGIHVSTVSRAISKKYIQTPRGIFEMKYFFTGGFQSSQGTVESWPALRQKMLEIIAKEDKTHPLSDEEIAEKLRSRGIDIARRTITKYRKSIKIPSSRRRRQGL